MKNKDQIGAEAAHEIGKVIGKELQLGDYGESVALMIPKFHAIIKSAIEKATERRPGNGPRPRLK